MRQVQKGRTRSQLDAAFKERFDKDQVKSISTDGSPAKGPANAPVQIVEWADFECPFCGRTAPVLDNHNCMSVHQGHAPDILKPVDQGSASYRAYRTGQSNTV